jgi:hypothetical protein
VVPLIADLSLNEWVLVLIAALAVAFLVVFGLLIVLDRAFGLLGPNDRFDRGGEFDGLVTIEQPAERLHDRVDEIGSPPHGHV